MPEIVNRPVDAALVARLVAEGCDARLAPLFAARGLASVRDAETAIQGLAAPEHLSHVDRAAVLIADGIARGERFLIVADYDADGATACAVGVRALRSMGATVDYLVPNRFEHGYGLTPEIVREAAARKPDWLITVDNGIAAVEGIDEANRLGMKVLVTDHHLPGATLPEAACIVNPNQAGCGFPSKHLAGVGVIFYVMLALRAELRRRGAFAEGNGPNLATLLDLVALGTVADVVRLDANNRILVAQGLARIRRGLACPGIVALLEAAGRSPGQATAQDLGFSAGPRINAAGRLDDMSLGIACLVTDEPGEARALAAKLDALNRERRAIEGEMQVSALALLEAVEPTDAFTLSVHSPEWHTGVVGLLASRLKDRFHRPVFAFARDGDTRLRGSGRSIAGLHLRDALDLIDKRCPGIIERFGGHAAAAGLTLRADALPEFAQAFEAIAREQLTPADLARRIETDGELPAAHLTTDFATLLRGMVWGQGFPEPRFRGRFHVESQRVVGERHLKLTFASGGQRFGAIRFGDATPLPDDVTAVYRLAVDEFRGAACLSLIVEHVEAV